MEILGIEEESAASSRCTEPTLRRQPAAKNLVGNQSRATTRRVSLLEVYDTAHERMRRRTAILNEGLVTIEVELVSA